MFYHVTIIDKSIDVSIQANSSTEALQKAKKLYNTNKVALDMFDTDYENEIDINSGIFE